MGSDAFDLVAGKYRSVMNRVVALGDVIGQKLQMFLREFRQHGGANGACGVAPKSGVQHVWRDADSTDTLDIADRLSGILYR
jgi:hypothetical protein